MNPSMDVVTPCPPAHTHTQHCGGIKGPWEGIVIACLDAIFMITVTQRLCEIPTLTMMFIQHVRWQASGWAQTDKTLPQDPMTNQFSILLQFTTDRKEISLSFRASVPNTDSQTIYSASVWTFKAAGKCHKSLKGSVPLTFMWSEVSMQNHTHPLTFNIEAMPPRCHMVSLQDTTRETEKL